MVMMKCVVINFIKSEHSFFQIIYNILYDTLSVSSLVSQFTNTLFSSQPPAFLLLPYMLAKKM